VSAVLSYRFQQAHMEIKSMKIQRSHEAFKCLGEINFSDLTKFSQIPFRDK